jgi:hypothetical protein
MEAAAKSSTAAAAAAGAHSSSSNATASIGTASNGCNGPDDDPAGCSPGRVMILVSGIRFGADLIGYFVRFGHPNLLHIRE